MLPSALWQLFVCISSVCVWALVVTGFVLCGCVLGRAAPPCGDGFWCVLCRGCRLPWVRLLRAAVYPMKSVL